MFIYQKTTAMVSGPSGRNQKIITNGGCESSRLKIKVLAIWRLLIYEYGVSTVTEALCKLEKISPLDMSADKVALLCAKREESLKQSNIKTDRLSEKSKNTLSQYDRLRMIQNSSERKVV